MILTLFLIHTAVCTTVALNPSTQGHVFYTGFIGNLQEDSYTRQKFQLRVLTLRETTVIFNMSSGNGFNYTGNTTLNNPALVNIPNSFEVLNYTYEYRDLGLMIQSSPSQPIFVLGIIKVDGETSATFEVHPYIEQPNKEYVYYGISFKTDTWAGYVKQLLVGCKDNTNITIKPSVDITVSANLQQPSSDTITVQAGESYTFILDELQTLVLYSNTDTTGTKVISNKPLSVITGQFSSNGLTTTQLPPTITWGKTFILPPLGRYIHYIKEQHFKVIASEDTTRVDIQCNTDRLINAQLINENQFYQFSTRHTEYCSVVTNKPCYIAGFYVIEVNIILGGHLMVTVPPLEQYTKDDVIIAPHTGLTFYTVIIPHDYNTDSFLINTNKFSINWVAVNYSNGSIAGYVYSGYLDNTTDINTFSASGRFLLIVFGFTSGNTGFGYTPNMELNPINSPPVYIRFVSPVYYALEENEIAVLSIEKESSAFIGDVSVQVCTKRYMNSTAEGKLITILYNTHYYPATTTEGIDFKAINKTIVLRQDQTVFNLTIVLIDDDIPEIEYFTIEIIPLDNNIIMDDRAEAAIVISDSDGTSKSIVSLSQ